MTDINFILKTINISNEEFFEISKEKIEKFEDSLFELERFDTILIKAPSQVDITTKDKVANSELENVVIVTHGGVMRSVLCEILQIKQLRRFYLGTPP